MNKSPQRNFIIGSEWLYYKLYTGHKTADQILVQIIKPITEVLHKSKCIDKWFFIRYADPKNHLRVRFHWKEGTANELSTIISLLHQYLDPYIKQDLIWKTQIDTYQRELERYGSSSMVLSESLFHLDSIATVQFLDLIEGDEGETLRWLFGLRSMDYFLKAFDYTLAEKLNLMDSLKTGFGIEFGMSRPLKKQLDNKYRKERENIHHFLSYTSESEPEYAAILDVLEDREKNMIPIAKQLLDLKDKNRLELDLNNLMGSYMHMLMNRLFTSKNRLNEMVCYDFLYRHYKSLQARQRRK